MNQVRIATLLALLVTTGATAESKEVASETNAPINTTLSAVSGASATTPDQAPKTSKETEVAESVKKSIPLPLDGVSVVKAKNGKDVIVSTNGRFQFLGQVRDLYTNQLIQTVDDAEDARYLTLSQMSLSSADTAPIPFGNPNIPLQARVMIDPYCPECLKLLKQLDEQKDKLHVELLITPITGQKAITQGLAMWCAYEKDYNMGRQIVADLIKGPPYPKYEENPGCNGQRVILNSMLTRVLNMPGLPAIWRVDGFAQAGIPDNLLTFLTTRRSTPAKDQK